ncbi:MAG: NERD domain-containing protein [Flavobacteriaceae bacterium]|nr:NERD domain-containing protein [Flavobacteriaceae bacterium]
MARVFGITESLKSLKSELNNNGIYKFNSVKQIKDFLSNYKLEKLSILKSESDKLDEEYSKTSSNLKQLIISRDKIINSETNRIDNKISDVNKKIDIIKSRDVNFIIKLFLKIKLYSLNNQLNQLISSKNSSIDSLVKDVNKNIESDEFFIKTYKKDKQNLIKKGAKSKLDELEHTRNVLENLKNLISGAIGENLVVKEIKKLGDDYALINDFNLRLSPPIYYKKHNERIRSVQIDHLLISRAGIFIIETKNWSKASVNTNNLRSPIKQIQRSNFALYIYISENISLNEHHWGEQTIPIRNLIVMINNKPTGRFKYVAVKLLKELNDYLKYFEPVLTQSQLDKVIKKFKGSTH